jgi:parallel beta helix pectate lyase-like protein
MSYAVNRCHRSDGSLCPLLKNSPRPKFERRKEQRTTMNSKCAYVFCAACLLTVTFTYGALGGVKQVNCATGQSFVNVLAAAQPGDTIRVVGTCTERVVITTDHLTLDGQGMAVLDGGGPKGGSFAGVIVIDGARGVNIKGFTVQNGPNGIVSINGAAFSVSHSKLQNHAAAGILVADGSAAELTNTTMRHNAAGMNVIGGSGVVLKGAVVANENAGNGIFVGGASLMEIRGATVEASNNQLNGLVLDGAHGVIFGFSESQGSSITANYNGLAGIGVPNGVLEDAGSGPNMVGTAHNGRFGIFLPIGGTLDSPFNASRFTVSSNPIGIYFGPGSKAIVHGGLVVQNNAVTGVFGDGADSINVNASPIPIPPNPSNITGNGVDVDLRFGSRSTFGNALVIGTMVCDKTVLSRGTIVCP